MKNKKNTRESGNCPVCKTIFAQLYNVKKHMFGRHLKFLKVFLPNQHIEGIENVDQAWLYIYDTIKNGTNIDTIVNPYLEIVKASKKTRTLDGFGFVEGD